MMKIIRKYPWILYLKVETNLKPTISVLNSFGFDKNRLKILVDKIPSILALDQEWTIPEKLLSLQKMFYLNQNSLVELIIKQPYLLTSSIDRNLEIANFFTDEVFRVKSFIFSMIFIICLTH